MIIQIVGRVITHVCELEVPGLGGTAPVTYLITAVVVKEAVTLLQPLPIPDRLDPNQSVAVLKALTSTLSSRGICPRLPFVVNRRVGASSACPQRVHHRFIKAFKRVGRQILKRQNSIPNLMLLFRHQATKRLNK